MMKQTPGPLSGTGLINNKDPDKDTCSLRLQSAQWQTESCSFGHLKRHNLNAFLSNFEFGLLQARAAKRLLRGPYEG